MKVSDYIIDFFINHGITDAFGIPGGVILDLLYAMEKHKGKFAAHLSFNEQCAAFAACGYAQASSNVGVAYATRGPGITNMVTAIADAYYDSIPTIFITAHAVKSVEGHMRVSEDQELNPIPIFSSITKYAVRIDKIEDVYKEINMAYEMAIKGRKGPVVLDFLSSLFSEDIVYNHEYCEKSYFNNKNQIDNIIERIVIELSSAQRPILLIGDGVNQTSTCIYIKKVSEDNHIPVLSSRFSADVIPDSPNYFGYVGSHGIRYSNFILSKADLIIALGNRMAFPVSSESFKPVVEHARTIRIDIDETEFLRDVPNSTNYVADLCELLPRLSDVQLMYEDSKSWISICKHLKQKLWKEDTETPVTDIALILQAVGNKDIIVSDVGNNEFWVSRAAALVESTNRILYSKSFGALGNSLGKGIGVYYAAKSRVVCFVGDQGIQINIQELQYIGQHKLPILIIVLNNSSSGMIKSRERLRYKSHFVHTTTASGYGIPDFKHIAKGFGLSYFYCTDGKRASEYIRNYQKQMPIIIELKIDEELDLIPNLPKGFPCQKLVPSLNDKTYQELNDL